MPQPQKHQSQADRQRAYRERQAQARQAEQLAKGVPALPAVPSIPGTARWDALISVARCSLERVLDEMQGYYDDRSEAWQEGERAEAFQEKLDRISEAIAALDELN